MKKCIHFSQLLILLAVISGHYFISCKTAKQNIRAINFRNNMSSVFDPQSYAIDEGRYLYFYKDYTVFLLDKQILDYGILVPDSNNIYSGSQVNRRLVFNYLVFKKNSRIGMKYDSLTIITGVRIDKDSIFKKYANRKSAFYESGNFKLVSTEILSDGVLQQKYTANYKHPVDYSDSAYCYFSKKLNAIDFSYNTTLDSLLNMKLFKTEFIYDSLYKSKPAIEIGVPRILRDEMKEIKVDNPSLIISLCKRYEKEINNK